MGLPAGDILFLPQKAYLPQDTLRRVLSYQLAQTPDTPQLRHVLTLVGLPALYVRLDEAHDWSRILSGGEQQRLALARAFYYGLRFVLDEATSHLDDAAAIDLLAVATGAARDDSTSHQPPTCGLRLFEHHWVLAPRR
jgi:putative ATP-binding cassette transporter